ncbi:ATP phosphoribosyltransferase (ATP-PRTase) (ATP-PRT) [Ceratobasidium sp. 394]|nr:ATP phosphoribosyltransferase (ATP-PRTase) (ATP-PRT) [Ceratobasidium sp. 394]
MTLSGPLSHLSSQHCSSSSSSSESLSGDSPTESSCPSTISASSDEEQEPHIFSSVTKVAYDKVAPITWGSPSSFIPKRGRLFVNVVRQDGTTFSSRSSIFSRNHTPSVSRPASEIAVIDEIPNAEVDTNGPLELKDDSPLADLPTLGPRGTDPAVPGVLRVDATKTGDGIHNTLALPQVSKLASSSIPIPSPSVISNSFDDRLLFAVPKKGRLHDKCMDLLRRADLQFAKPNRLDICVVKNLPITLVFLPAADIPRFVGQSNVDISITGQDVVLESGIQSLTKEMLRLGFGRCKLQVQVPANSKIEREEDLAGRRIATSFETIAGEHFGKIDRRMGTKTRIEYLSGSVETACTLGLAEGIGAQRLIQVP